MAVGVSEKLHIDRVVAQQIDDHPVLGLWIRQRQGLACLVEDRFLQALLSPSKLRITWLRVAPLFIGLPLRRTSSGEVTGIGC